MNYAGNSTYFFDGATSWSARNKVRHCNLPFYLAEALTVAGITYPVGTEIK